MCSYNFLCKGGFVVTVGYRKVEGDKKDPVVWIDSIGSTGDVVIKDLFEGVISLLEKANKQLQKMQF